MADGGSVVHTRGSIRSAAYIVLAEKLGAALITRDARLAAASGHSGGFFLPCRFCFGVTPPGGSMFDLRIDFAAQQKRKAGNV